MTLPFTRSVQTPRRFRNGAYALLIFLGLVPALIAADPNPGRLSVSITSRSAPAGLPCRITVLDESGQLADLKAFPSDRLAVRPGVVYTADGHAELELAPGNYALYATRGFEYGLAKTRLNIRAGESSKTSLRLEREVETQGWVSCDTHIHTLTYSGHGDATVDERVVTLAAEGIELPVSTEHNLAIDYATAAERMGVRKHFTPVIGDEVTTPSGHFNVFPILSGTSPPPFKTTNWTDLLRGIRGTPSVQFVILNHPRDLHSNFRPFDPKNFDPATGANRRGPEFSFDGLELINSGALQSDFMRIYRDWFALLNYGYKITGVGASDCHDVNRYIVGQGRTYLRVPDRDPAHLDVNRACASLRAGAALVSFGLLTELRVNGQEVGGLVKASETQLQVHVRVLGPSWTVMDRVELFANGVKVREKKFGPARKNPGLKAEFDWRLPVARQDMYLVAIASGPGVTEPYWEIAKPYQPTSPVWEPRCVGSTNPIWVDADGDGKMTHARAYAEKIVQRTGTNWKELFTSLAEYDEAVATQAASLAIARGMAWNNPEVQQWIAAAPKQVRAGFNEFEKHNPQP